jgi:hypothetical protein
MKIQELAALIEIRNFAYNSVDNLSIKLSRDEIRLLQNKIPLLNKYILDNIVELNLPLVEESSKETRSPKIKNETTK